MVLVGTCDIAHCGRIRMATRGSERVSWLVNGMPKTDFTHRGKCECQPRVTFSHGDGSHASVKKDVTVAIAMASTLSYIRASNVSHAIVNHRSSCFSTKPSSTCPAKSPHCNPPTPPSLTVLVTCRTCVRRVFPSAIVAEP